jgi:acyl-CoA synthetase (AMP-forming)/AMP-acid ligase II
MYLAFTSGTTGKPKGVLHSDNTLLATARMMARDWRLERAVLYSLSPLSHNLGLGALITALAGGGELVVHDLPRGGSMLDRLKETGAEFLFGVPTHAIDLLSEMRDPTTMKYTFVDTCFETHHLQFGFDKDDTLWTSGASTRSCRAQWTVRCGERSACSPARGRSCD